MAFNPPTRTVIVRNQSARLGYPKPVLIVLHTTEGHNRPGVEDLMGLASYFDQTSTQASSHIANDAEGHDIRMVPDERKAWTQSAFNSPSLSIEQTGFASTSRDEWFKEAPRQLANSAKWIAVWSLKWDIPIRRGVTTGGGSILRTGVVGHKQLGAAGGGHVDPGTGYPFDYVIDLARYLRAREKDNTKGRQKWAAKVNPTRKHYGLTPVV